MDGAVGIPCDMHLIAGNFQQCPQIKQDIEIDALLRNTVRSGAAAVDAAVWCISLN